MVARGVSACCSMKKVPSRKQGCGATLTAMARHCIAAIGCANGIAACTASGALTGCFSQLRRIDGQLFDSLAN